MEAKAADLEAKQQRKARAIQNQAAKQNRETREQEQQAAAEMAAVSDGWAEVAEGTEYLNTATNTVFRKEADTLYCEATRTSIPTEFVARAVASGTFICLGLPES